MLVMAHALTLILAYDCFKQVIWSKIVQIRTHCETLTIIIIKPMLLQSIHLREALKMTFPTFRYNIPTIIIFRFVNRKLLTRFYHLHKLIQVFFTKICLHNGKY